MTRRVELDKLNTTIGFLTEKSSI